MNHTIASGVGAGYHKEMGERDQCELKALVRMRGFQVKLLAKEAHISAPQMSRWINGRGVMPADSRPWLADKLRISVDQLDNLLEAAIAEYNAWESGNNGHKRKGVRRIRPGDKPSRRAG